MATIKEFKKWLDRFPEETIIEVGFQQKAGNYESYGAVEFETLDLKDADSGDGWDFKDFRNNRFVESSDEMYGKCFLTLGDSV